MLKMTSLAVAASLLLVGGCDKKAEEGTVQKATEATGAAPPPPPQTEPAKPLTGTALADGYKACIELINAAKWDDFKKTCVEAAYVLHDNGDGSTRKLEDLMGWFQTMKAGMPDFKLSPQLIMVSGRNILAVELVTGTHTAPLKSPMGELPASNKKIGMLMFHRLAINEANKATEEWAYADPTTLMSQLGVAPKDGPAKRAALEKGIEGAPIVVVTADDAKEKANLEAVKKVTDSINAGKIADASAVFAPDALESDQVLAMDAKGAKPIENGLKMWFGAFKDAKLTVDGTWAAGDYVVETGTFSGVHDKDLGPIKKTGKPVQFDYAEVVQLKDGKITNLWRFRSGLVLAMQLGLMPAPGSGSAGSATAPATK